MAGRTLGSITTVWRLDDRSFKKGLSNSRKDVNKFAKDVKGLGGLIGGAFAIKSIANFALEAGKLAAKMEGVNRAFARIRPNIAYLSELETATAGTVSQLDLMRRAVMAANFKIPLDQLGSLLKFATKRAQETGESVDYLVNSIVIGIGRKSPLILDNLGISAVELRKKLDGVGHSGATVGDVAKAVGQIAEEELSKMGDVVETTAIKQERLNAEIQNYKIELGNVVNQIMGKVYPAITALIDNMLLLGRVASDVWKGLGGEGGGPFSNAITGEQMRIHEQQIRDGASRAVELWKNVVLDKAKDFEEAGMGSGEAFSKALNDAIYRTYMNIQGATGASKEVYQDIFKALKAWKQEIDNADIEDHTYNLKNLREQLKLLQEQQELLVIGSDEFVKVQWDILQVQNQIDAALGKKKKKQDEEIEQLTALELLVRKADNAYKDAAKSFLDMANASMELRTTAGSFLYQDEETFEGEEPWEKMVADAGNARDKMANIMGDLKQNISKYLLNSLSDLGEAFTRVFNGMEADLAKLGAAILENIGNLLIMAGFKMLEFNPALGAGLIAGGAALQLGGGIARGMSGGQQASGYAYRTSDHTMSFRISGKDLVGTLKRYNTSNYQNT